MFCTPVASCRICNSTDLLPVISLGEQAFTGFFPRTASEQVPSGPLDLVKCDESTGGCGLVQLGHNFAQTTMYGHNYGYRSGLNQSMVRHLHGRVRKIRELANPVAGDLVIDIGSNDSTTLRGYPTDLDLVGIDPTGVKFGSYYPDHVRLIPDFFNADLIRKHYPGRKAKVISSFAMFYDLPDPTQFMRDIVDSLADDGIWVFEQSYLPAMIREMAYDTICHEHFSYYALRQIKWMTDRVGLKIIDLEENDVNGGSFAVTVAHRNSTYREATPAIDRWLAAEYQMGLSGRTLFQNFRDKVFEHRDTLVSTLQTLQAEGRSVYGYGASTKGNVLLQFCGLTSKDLPAMAEVNQDKFGCFTPGTRIPIWSEAEVKACRPDCLLVMPWHFRDNIIEREMNYVNSGGTLLFPLPGVELVDRNTLTRLTKHSSHSRSKHAPHFVRDNAPAKKLRRS